MSLFFPLFLTSINHKYYNNKMTKNKPTTKEQLIYFLLQNVSLGTYDRRFLQNIMDNYVSLSKPLTSNQANLFETKIVTRYNKQLFKLELDSVELSKLPWLIKPIQSLPQFTEVYLDLVDDTLVLRSPFKKEFINDFKKNDINAKWDMQSRFWYMPASTNNLKIVNKEITKHYSKINYCKELTKFFDILKNYDQCKYWNPTYKFVNGRYMIVATNRHLNEATSNLQLDDNLITLSKLVQYGVNIDDSIKEICYKKFDKDLVNFCVNFKSELDMKDNCIVEKIKATESDFVYLYFKLHRGSFVQQLTEKLKEHNINFMIHDNSYYSDITPAIHEYNYPIFITDRNMSQHEKPFSNGFAKIVRMVNSKPIEVK